MSGKKITSLLAEINRKPEDLDAILITHEHSDHIHGVGVLARKYGMDLYANEKTWQAMENSKYLGKVDASQKHIFEMGKTKTFGDIDIESFGVSHFKDVLLRRIYLSKVLAIFHCLPGLFIGIKIHTILAS